MTERLVLLREPGARWESALAGPMGCAGLLIAELIAGVQVHWFGLSVCAAVLGAVTAALIQAKRSHASVELTADELRNGTEVLSLSQVAAVLPARARPGGVLSWESARALGELSDVPKGRTAVGLRLAGGGEVRAWARDGDWLRVLLNRELEGRKV